MSRLVYWDAKQLALVGKLPDEEVAARTGHPLNTVRIKRCQLGLPVSNPKVPRWTPGKERFLGADMDKDIERQTGSRTAWKGLTAPAIRKGSR